MMTLVPGPSGVNSGGILDESEQELRENGWMKDLIKCASSLSYSRQEVNRTHDDATESEEKTVYPRFYLEMMGNLNDAVAPAAAVKHGEENNYSLLKPGRNARRIDPNMPSSGVLLTTKMPMSSEVGHVMSRGGQCDGVHQEKKGELLLYTTPMALNPSDISGLDSVSCISSCPSESDLRESDLVLKCTTCDGSRDLLVKNEMQWEGIEDERHGEHEQLGNIKEEEATNHVAISSSPSPSAPSRFQVLQVSLPGLAAFISPIVALCFLAAALCARDLHVPPRRGLILRSPLPSTAGKQKNFGNQEDGHHSPIIDRWDDATAEDEREKSSAPQQATGRLVVEAGKHKSLAASTLEANEMVILALLEWRDTVLQSFNGPSPNQLAVTEGAAILERLLEMEKELHKPDKRWWRCHIESRHPGVPKPVVSPKKSDAADPLQDRNANQQQYHHLREDHLSLEASLVVMAKKMVWYRERSTFAEFERLTFLNACGAAAGLITQAGVVAAHNKRHYWCSRSNHSDEMRRSPTTLRMHHAV